MQSTNNRIANSAVTSIGPTGINASGARDDSTNYLFADVQGIATQSFAPKLILFDAGAAWRPFERIPHLEFRAGSSGTLDIRSHEQSILFYGAVRVIF